MCSVTQHSQFPTFSCFLEAPLPPGALLEGAAAVISQTLQARRVLFPQSLKRRNTRDKPEVEMEGECAEMMGKAADKQREVIETCMEIYMVRREESERLDSQK